ncbi:RING finger protein 17 isoform X2 [Anabrus simplex]|uniref:RING finger protein 17 isoform X2 n=1 Tax=Anabrus simplex TaxID=316456 RepID=UPI0034DD3945
MDSCRINKLATCSQCSQLFTIRDPLRPRGFRCPLVLPCGHSVCEQCVRSSLQSSNGVVCAVCGSKAPFSQAEIMKKDIPINMYLLGCFVDNFSTKQTVDTRIVFQPAGMNLQTLKKGKGHGTKPGSTTEICSECGTASAVWSCPQCAVLYCNQCYMKVHKAAKALQKHTKIQLGIDVLVPAFTQPRCKVHPEQKLEYHCKECDLVMCPMCAIEGHAKHSIWTIRERNEAVLPEVKEAYDKANVVLKRLMKAQKDVKNIALSSDTTNKVANDVLVQTQRAVSRHFVDLHGALQLLETSILGQLEHVGSGAARSLELAAQELDLHIENVKQLLDEAVAVCDPSNLPQSDVLKVLEKLQAAGNLPCHLLTEEPNDDVQLKFSVDASFVEQLKSHCHLEVPAMRKFILVPTEDLPEDYKLETIDESAPELSSGSRTSSVSALSDIALSDSSSVTSSSRLLNAGQPAKGCTEIVTVSHIKDPSSFYVIRESDKKRLDMLSKQLHQYVSRGARPPAVVLQDGLYIVQFDADKNWYRARVKKVFPNVSELEEEKIEVLYIDYGNTEIVPISRLRCINPKHTVIPPFAQHCGLFGITPKGGKWTHESIKTMAQMLDGWRVIMTVMGHSGGVYLVDLSRLPGEEDSDVPMSVRDAMIFLELGCFMDSAVPLLQSTPLNKQYLGPETIKKGLVYEVVVSHIDTPASFYVQKLGSHAQYLTSVMEDMNQTYTVAGQRGMIYTPNVGMPCAAQYSLDKKWYRAKVMGLPGQKNVEVFYVDYGNSEILSWTSLRKLKDRFLRIAPQAIHCSMTDVIPISGSVWSLEAKMYFLKIATKKLLMLFVDEVLKTHCRVTLYESQSTIDICLNALLVKSGHATSTGSSSVLVEYHKTGARVLTSSNKGPKKGNLCKSPVAIQKHRSKKQSKATRQNSRTNVSSDSSELQDSSTEKIELGQEPEDGGGDSFRLEVTVLSAVNPSCLYVSLTSQQDIMDDLMSELQAYYNSMDTDDFGQPWSVNDKCCAFNQKERKWYRGIIAEINGSLVKVFLKDFAIVETVPITYLRRLVPQFMEVRDGAVKCHLAGIRAAGDKAEWPTLACEQLTEIVNRYDTFYISKKGEIENFSLPIELWVKDVIPGGPLEPTTEHWSTVNQKLVDQGLAIPVRSEPNSETVPSSQVLKELQEQNQDMVPVSISECVSCEKEPEDKEMVYTSDSPERLSENDDSENESENNLGETLTDWLPAVPITKKKFSGIPTYVDDECSIYLHETGNDETLKVIQKALQSRLQNSQPKPHDLYWFAGQLCIAQYLDKNWYRGRVIEVNDDHTVKVLFVDYGNIEDLKATEMRKNVYMGHIPVQCHKYKLDGIVPVSDTGKWPTVVLDFVHSTIVEKKCKITVKSNVGDGTPPLISVTAPGYIDLAALLVNMQYAKYTNASMQIKASIEPPMFKLKFHTGVSYIDQESDSGSVIIEEEEEVNSVLEEGTDLFHEGKEEAEVMEEGEKELVSSEEGTGGEKVENQMVNLLIEGEGGDDDVVVESEVETLVLNEEKICMPVDKEECACQVSSEEEKYFEASSEEKNSVLINKVEGMVKDDILTRANIQEDTMSEEEERTREQTPVEEQNIVQNLVREEKLLQSAKEEVKLETTEQNAGKVGTHNLLEIKKEEPLSWADCLSEDESEQEGMGSDDKYQSYKVLDLLNYNEVLVEVSAIIAPNEVVIRPVECEKNVELIKDFLLMSMKMQDDAKFQPHIVQPYVGQPCCVCYKEDGQWYRATILSVEPKTAQLRIQYVDYGNVELVGVNEIHELKPEWTKVPVQGIPCQLWKVEAPATFDPTELLTRITDCLFHPPLRAKIKCREPMMSVELFAGDSNVLVYQPLIDAGLLAFEGRKK